MKDHHGKIRKLKNAIERGDLKGFTIDRSKSQQEIDTQVDRLAGEFQVKESFEEIHELERDGGGNYGGLREMLPVDQYLDRPPFRKLRGKMRRKRGTTPKKRRRERAKSLAFEFDLSGRWSMGNMPKSGLEGEKGNALFRLGILNGGEFGNVHSITRLRRIPMVLSGS